MVAQSCYPDIGGHESCHPDIGGHESCYPDIGGHESCYPDIGGHELGNDVRTAELSPPIWTVVKPHHIVRNKKVHCKSAFSPLKKL